MAIELQKIADKARKHASSEAVVKNSKSEHISHEGYILRAKNSYQAGYTDCIEDNKIRFHRSFEDLYAIAMQMADTCIGAKLPEERFAKLEEEYQELVNSWAGFKDITTNRQGEYMEALEDLLGEAGDVLFVLLHIAHKLQPGTTAFSLLHGAMTKMLARMNDQNYIAKI